MDLSSTLCCGTWDERASKTTAPFLPRAHAGQPDGYHHHSGGSAVVPVCDVRPVVLCLRPALAPEADGLLQGMRSLEGHSLHEQEGPCMPATGTRHGS